MSVLTNWRDTATSLIQRNPSETHESAVNAAEHLLIQLEATGADAELLTGLGEHISTMSLCMSEADKHRHRCEGLADTIVQALGNMSESLPPSAYDRVLGAVQAARLLQAELAGAYDHQSITNGAALMTRAEELFEAMEGRR